MTRTAQQNRAHEIWKDIPGYEGIYQISSQGRVKSLPRLVKGKNHRCPQGYQCTRKERVLSPAICGTGYWKVGLYKNGVMKNHNVHRMMAVAFIPNPNGYTQVNHKDGNKMNCKLSNLEWCTPSQNGKHAYAVIGIVPHQKNRYGEENNSSKAVLQKTGDGVVVQRWGSAMDAVRAGFDSSCISRCCNGESGRHRGYVWEFESAN